MKKANWLLVFMLAVTQELSAQTFDEWFRQNQTQLKYLVVQIAALQAYSSVLQAGYGIAMNGLDSIAWITETDETMHRQYFMALKLASPAVENDPRVASIQEYSRAIAVLADAIAANGTSLQATVAANLKEACIEDLTWLKEILTDGELAMGDEGRLHWIGKLYSNARGRYAFAVDLWGQLLGIQK